MPSPLARVAAAISRAVGGYFSEGMLGPVAVVAFLFRLVIGLFFSAMIAFVGWAIVRLVHISFFEVTPASEQTVAVMSVGIGAGIGASIGLLMLGLSNTHLALRATAVIAVGIIGGWAGLEFGKNVDFMGNLPGMPGIPELAGTVWGGMIAANIFAALLDIVTSVRNQSRLRSERDAITLRAASQLGPDFAKHRRDRHPPASP